MEVRTKLEFIEVKTITGKEKQQTNNKFFTTVVSKKKINRAVDRNQIKRIFRNEFQKNKQKLNDQTLVIYYIGPEIKKLSKTEKQNIWEQTKKIFLSLATQ